MVGLSLNYVNIELMKLVFGGVMWLIVWLYVLLPRAEKEGGQRVVDTRQPRVSVYNSIENYL